VQSGTAASVFLVLLWDHVVTVGQGVVRFTSLTVSFFFVRNPPLWWTAFVFFFLSLLSQSSSNASFSFFSCGTHTYAYTRENATRCARRDST
jgi:magnesium-transporting ATPase (P-type)